MSVKGVNVPDLFSGVICVARNPVNKSPRAAMRTSAQKRGQGRRGALRRLDPYAASGITSLIILDATPFVTAAKQNLVCTIPVLAGF